MIIIVFGTFLLFIFTVILSALLISTNKDGYISNINDFVKNNDLDFDVLQFSNPGEIFYIYRKNFDGRKYLKLYGFLSQEDVAKLIGDESFKTFEEQQATSVSVESSVPDDLLIKMNIRRAETPKQFTLLYSDEDGNVYILTKQTKQYYCQIQIADTTGAFVLRLISPPR